MKFQECIVIAEGLVQLLSPSVEVVIHDLKKGVITYIAGGLSQRKIGDDSLIDLSDFKALEEEVAKGVYKKIGVGGKLFKSISLPIKDRGELIGLLCINYDISLFHDMQRIAGQVMSTMGGDRSGLLFKDDWQEGILTHIYSYLNEHGLSWSGLKNKDKKRIVAKLHEHGAFCQKNAAEYIADVLDLSRATIFNYLKALRN